MVGPSLSIRAQRRCGRGWCGDGLGGVKVAVGSHDELFAANRDGSASSDGGAGLRGVQRSRYGEDGTRRCCAPMATRVLARGAWIMAAIRLIRDEGFTIAAGATPTAAATTSRIGPRSGAVHCA